MFTRVHKNQRHLLVCVPLFDRLARELDYFSFYFPALAPIHIPKRTMCEDLMSRISVQQREWGNRSAAQGMMRDGQGAGGGAKSCAPSIGRPLQKSDRIESNRKDRGSRASSKLASHAGGREGWLQSRVLARAAEHGMGKEEEEIYEGFVRFLSRFDDEAMVAVCKDAQSDVEEGRLLMGKFGGFDL